MFVLSPHFTLGLSIYLCRTNDTDLSLVVAITDAQIGHRPQYGDEGLYGVTVHDRSILFEVLACKPALVDNPETSNICNFASKNTVSSLLLFPVATGCLAKLHFVCNQKPKSCARNIMLNS